MINVSIDYMSASEWGKVDWQKVRENWPMELAEEKPETCPFYGSSPARLTYEEATMLSTSGVALKIVPLPGAMINKIADVKIWEYGSRIEAPDLMSGAAVQIAVPDMALMYIDEVCVETDFCTDALQDMLDEGWRILAVCPPNSQRRPDYILGRRKKQDPFS